MNLMKYLPAPRALKISWKLKRNDRVYSALVKDAKQKKDWHLEQHLHGEWDMEDSVLQEELDSILSSRLRRKAQKMRLPTPAFTGKEDDPNWERGRFTGRYYLSDLGMKAIRDEIRAEWKARSELFLPWGTLLVGLIGALTGLLAIILN